MIMHVNPARAGMIRASVQSTHALLSKPRASGYDPHTKNFELPI